MKYRAVITLKNGAPCLIRSAEASDAREVCDNFNLTHSETDFLLSYPDENSFDVPREEQFLRDKEASADEAELCAVVDGRIVGTAGIEAMGRKYKMKHRAELGISIEKKYWGLGVGRALVSACIECAKAAGYAQLELSVVADNAAAIALYKKLGFEEFGRNPKGFRSRETGWQELVMMRLELNGGN